MGPDRGWALAINDAGAARHNWAAPRKGGPFRLFRPPWREAAGTPLWRTQPA